MLQDRLSAALTSAIRTRDRVAVAALRSALAAVANAEAVPVPPQTGTDIVLGVGPSEVPRRELSEPEIAAIVTREITDRRSAAELMQRHGQRDRAARLMREALVLEEHLG